MVKYLFEEEVVVVVVEEEEGLRDLRGMGRLNIVLRSSRVRVKEGRGMGVVVVRVAILFGA